MDYNVLDALAMITREKNLDRRVVIDSLVAGLQSAARKKLGAEALIDARVDETTGEMIVEQVKNVVAEVEDPDTEISLAEARAQFGNDVQVGDEVRWNLPLEEFGRNAILVAKQILVQKVREAERSNVYEQYKDKVDQVITGTVQQVDRGSVLVSLGRVEALLPYREQIRGERYHQGQPIQALVVEVLDSLKGPQIILSRSHPNFLKALFEQEVPEIQEGIVEIKAVAREPGSRSKIAVVSHDDRVDAVGSCVGMKGSRVQAVSRALAGERIDIVPWSADPQLLIGRALSPAEVNQILLDEEQRIATVVVAEDQLSKAIGKEGKNVRLAAKLTEWKIDLISSREFHIRQRVLQEVNLDLEEMTGVTPKLAAGLRAAGLATIEDVANAELEELMVVPGIGPKTAETLRETAVATIDELNRIIEATVAEEMAKIQAESRPLFDDSLLEEEAESPAAAAPAGPEHVTVKKDELFRDFDDRISRLEDESADESADEPGAEPGAESGAEPGDGAEKSDQAAASTAGGPAAVPDDAAGRETQGDGGAGA